MRYRCPVLHEVTLTSFSKRWSLTRQCSFLPTGTGSAGGSEPAAAAEDDDGTDALAVHLRLQSPHSVPEELQADLRSAPARPALSGHTGDETGGVSSCDRSSRSISEGAGRESGQV